MAMTLEEWIAQNLAVAPPLSDSQRARLWSLLHQPEPHTPKPRPLRVPAQGWRLTEGVRTEAIQLVRYCSNCRIVFRTPFYTDCPSCGYPPEPATEYTGHGAEPGDEKGRNGHGRVVYGHHSDGARTWREWGCVEAHAERVSG